MPDVEVTTGASAGLHDVVYVATEHDGVYAIDSVTGKVLWYDSLINPAAGVTSVPHIDIGGDPLVGPEFGVTATPVIDPTTNTIFVLANTLEVVNGVDHIVYRLHALDLGSGAEKDGGPALVADTSFNGLTFTYYAGRPSRATPPIASTGSSRSTPSRPSSGRP